MVPGASRGKLTWRVPLLTIAVVGVTAVVTASQAFVPDLLLALRRQPSMIEGFEIWRFVTSWLVHDGGSGQIAINFALLAGAGTLAETMFSRRAWIVAYVFAGLTGEVAGVFWQPIGAGNSVAIFGLLGLVAGWQAVRWDRVGPQRLGMTLALGAFAAWLVWMRDIHGPAALAGLAFGQIAARRGAIPRRGDDI